METDTHPQKMTLGFINDKSPILDRICNDLNALGIEALFRLENVQDGLNYLLTLKILPKACIIDLDFYDKNVLAQLQLLRTQYPTIQLIAHSDIDDKKVGKNLLDIGVSSYLLAGSDADDFKLAIDILVNG
ncbi:MAG: histidine kinase [Sphingobacterium sp. 40-24]|uniref:DNA-binding response regulator n=1 Tax=Sphingobacterium sp. 40-24 TaxID=1895843 RepID=UPI000969C94D|nr:DNA-binding response regulator [Sphingobacterium sp. 40-24]OJZ09686.1 MAG: histidine kinase [Sphingobacterium sp. 40-24]